MAKKTFILMLTILVVTFGFISLIKYYRPGDRPRVDISSFPMDKEGWQAKPFPLSQTVVDLLSPDAIFNSLYSNAQGLQIDLFFSYFAGQNTEGGVHSPRNCMPGSGWVIVGSEPHTVQLGDYSIPAERLWVKYGEHLRIMDFWYITQHGETANDYKLKLYQMFSALTFQPTDIAFVRFISKSDPESVAAMERFQQMITPDIYHYLPFERTS